MAVNRKLGRTTAQRKAMLRGLTTALIEHGKIETTETRAKEVKSIADKLIALAVKECDSYDSKEVSVSKPKLDSSGKKMTKTVTSKKDNDYQVIDREEVKELRQIDNPSRLAARRQMMKIIYKVSDSEGNNKNIVSKLMDEIGPKYKERQGGYTRMYKLGPRRGDGAEVVILELV